ncbi:MAG: ABC transporter permease [Actinomycetota bacterium]|nr:ABC transporter permease [Actinomycetota bacterium]
MNTGIDVVRIARFGALYIAAARFRSMFKWRTVIAAVDIGNPLFYLIAIGIGIGVLVENNSGTSGTSGIKYIAFIAPALLASSAITGVMDECVFPVIEGFKWRKLFYAQNATPITGKQIAIGVYLAALSRAVFSVVIYYLLLLTFNVVDFGISILIVPIAIMAGGSFGAVMLYFAAKVEKEDYFFNIIGRLIVMPMFLFSGTFFPLSSMPIYLQPIGWISPLWHATELGREAAFEYGLSPLVITTHLLFLTAVTVVGLILSIGQFERRLAK